MKISNINPKKIFRKKTRSDRISSTSPTSSSSNSSQNIKLNGSATPTSVLPENLSTEDWSESSSELNELVQAFKVIDRDGDGKITRSELGALLSRLGASPPTEEELSLMLNEMDRNGDGCISLEEFGAISSAFGAPACDSELRETFDFFDTDRDGKITAEELYCVFTSMGDGGCTLDDCRRMISGVDKNGDGFVCFEDFTLMMVQQLQR